MSSLVCSVRGALRAVTLDAGACILGLREDHLRAATVLATERPCRLTELQARVTRFDAAVGSLAQAARRPAGRG
jgi:hypothetical protein